jgi:hypothetical protein
MLKSIPGALAALLLLTGATLESQAAELALILDDTTSVIPADVSYRSTPEGLKVKGWVEKRQPHRGRILGHVEIRLLDAAGKALAGKDVYLSHYSPTRTNPQRASFSALLPVVPPGTAAIEVAHRVGGSVSEP